MNAVCDALASGSRCGGLPRRNPYAPMPIKVACAALALSARSFGPSSVRMRLGGLDCRGPRAAGSTGCALDGAKCQRTGAPCPAPLEGISAACENALERCYASMPVYDMHSYPRGKPREWWVPPHRHDRIVWWDLLDDPSSLRERVDIAMRRPECVAPEGATRRDLRASCDAASMTRLSLLLQACLPFYKQEDAEPRDWREEWEWEFEDVADANDDEVQPKEILAERVLHFAWRLRRCRAVPSKVFTLIESLPKPIWPPIVRTGAKRSTCGMRPPAWGHLGIRAVDRKPFRHQRSRGGRSRARLPSSRWPSVHPWLWSRVRAVPPLPAGRTDAGSAPRTT